MSVIQSIQEKYAKLMAIIIAIALITFVVMLAFENGGSLFGGGRNSTTVGKVNGRTIEYTAFVKKVDQQEQYMAQQGYGSGPMLQQEAVNAAWNQEIEQLIQTDELDKLGMKVGSKEMGDLLYGQNPPDDLKKQFTDPATGLYNGQMAKQQIDQVLKNKKGNAEQLAAREQLISYINYLQNNRLSEKYKALLNNSVNVPKWLVEKEIADKSQMATIAMVRENFSAINDSTIKITDKEIEEFISKNKDDYKQTENRSISYVTFSALPSAADSASARSEILQLKPEFDTTKSIESFLLGQGERNFYNGYINGNRIQIPVKDSIFRLPIGGVYGPYLDGTNYSMARLLASRTQPDTVNVRHILVATMQRDPQSGQFYPVRDSATARKKMDSIQAVLSGGAIFDSLVVQVSDDEGSKSKGGVYEKVEAGVMASEFNDYIFGNPTGSKGVVMTQFGFHYIEILSQKGNSPAYKVAYLSRPIETSTETDNNANNEASKFAAQSRDLKSFNANADKLKASGINKNIANEIVPSAYQIPGLGMSRSFIKNIFKADLGDVLEPEKVEDNYVVAVVTEVNEEGTKSAAKARIAVEPLLRNKKIAEKLKQKIGTPASLEAAAATLGGKQIEIVDSLRLAGMQSTPVAMSLGGEPKVIGASFNPANKGKITVIEGGSAIYVIRVDNITATAVAGANVAEERKSRIMQLKQQAMYRSPLQALREAATIKDRRSEFF
jgi:peptidyl-prolyl cis-trans isomerase D